MKREILLRRTIDAGDVFCEGCVAVTYTRLRPACREFRNIRGDYKTLKAVKGPSLRRLPECIAAEKGAKG